MQLDGRTKTENSMAEHKFVQLCMSYGSNIFQLPREIRKEKIHLLSTPVWPCISACSVVAALHEWADYRKCM